MDDGPDRVRTAHRQIALGRLFRRAKVLGHIDEQMLSVYRDLGVVVKNEAVNPNKTAEDRSIYQLVEPGWLVVNRMKAWQGSIGIADIRGIVSGHYICFRPAHRENDRFLHYLLRSPSYTAQFAAISRGVRPGQIEIDNDELTAIKVRLPPVDEQRRIADFLNDQVARIDNIIATRSSQSFAVGAELQADFAARVQSLASIAPVTRLSRFFDFVEQGSSPVGDAVGAEIGEVGVLKTSAIQRGRFLVSENKVVAPADFEPRFEIRNGDVILVRGSGSADLVADVTEVQLPSSHPRLMLSDLTYRLVGLRLSAPFAVAILLSAPIRAQIRAAVRQGSGPAKARGEDIAGLMIPVLSPAQQNEFTSAYWAARSVTDSARAALAHSNDLLTELKRSLITAVVTGEFDVSSADGSRVPVA